MGPEGGHACDEGNPGRSWRAPALALSVYLALAVLAYLPVLPFANGHVPATKLNDTISVGWFLDWVGVALGHGHDPLFGRFLDYPAGVNLTVNQSMSLAGVLAAPITLLLGPFAALNLWLRLAFVLSAGSMYFVLRYYCARELPAFLGGLLYGFSPFVVGHSLISPNFSLVAVPPLLFLALDDLLRGDRWSARRDGVALGVLSGVQLYLNPEMLAECVLAMAVAGALVLPGHLARDGPSRLGRLGRGASWASPVLGVLGAPFAWFYFAGPEHLHGPVVPLHYLAVFRTDLAGLVVPGRNQRIGPARLVALGTSYTSYAINETGVYLGIPLILLLVYLVFRLRKSRLVAYAGLLALVGLVLSLGRSLVVDNHHTGIWLPAALLSHVPVLQSAESIRFILLTYLGASVVLAVGLDHVAVTTVRSASRVGPQGGRWRLPGTLVILVVGGVGLFPLLPRWPYASEPTGIPAYFTSGAVRAVREGSVVLTYPYAQPGAVGPEMWQMASGLRFRLVGGYAYVADNGGIPFGSPPVRPPALVDLLEWAQTGGPTPPPAAGPATDVAIRAALRSLAVADFLMQPSGLDPSLVERELTAALGRPPVASGGILAWYDVPADLALQAGEPARLSGRVAGVRSR